MTNIDTQLNPKSGNIVLGILLGALIALIPSYYFYSKYQDTQKKLKNPQLVSQEEVKKVTKSLSVLMALPKDETPELATIADVSKLQKEPFFQKAKNGDKILIYLKARKAILYRESINKIVDVASINIQKSEQVQGAATTPTVTPAR